jgi:integrase
MRGNGRIFTRTNSSSLWIAYCHRGKEVRESVDKYLRANGVTRPATDNDAEKLLKLRLKHIGAEQLGLKPFVGPSQDKVLISELLDALEADLKLRQVRSLKGIQSHLKQVRNALGDTRAIDVSAEMVDRYIEARLSEKEPPAMATVNRETGLLSQAFRLGVERHRISSAPKIRKLSEKGNARQGFFEKADFEKLVKQLPEHLQGFVKFAYHSGWRKGEISSLEWADVDMVGKVIRLRPENSKTNESRILVLEGDLWEVISQQWAVREHEKRDETIAMSLYVFHQNGQLIGDIRKSWTAACKAANTEGKLFHDLRRTAVRNMVRAGVPERVAMAISGHKTRAIFDRYNIVSEEDLRVAMQRTQNYLKAASVEQTVTVFPGQKAASR